MVSFPLLLLPCLVSSAGVLRAGPAEKPGSPNPRNGLVLSKTSLETGRWSHFLTISAPGSEHHTVLAAKGATPIGVKVAASAHGSSEGRPRTAGRGQGQVAFAHQQPKKKRKIQLLISPSLHASLRDILWASSVT